MTDVNASIRASRRERPQFAATETYAGYIRDKKKIHERRRKTMIP